MALTAKGINTQTAPNGRRRAPGAPTGHRYEFRRPRVTGRRDPSTFPGVTQSPETDLLNLGPKSLTVSEAPRVLSNSERKRYQTQQVVLREAFLTQ